MRNLFIISLLCLSFLAEAQKLSGRVQTTENGRNVPLPGASVYWSGGIHATAADSLGRFSLDTTSKTNRLVISYVGYQADTLMITNYGPDLVITLKATQQLNEVVVTAGNTQIDRMNPIQTEVLTQRTLAKAACCNLSESFETNASVSVSYADAVTGAKQIQFMGLGGQYVQTNVENIPTIRGLATTFGLNYIPGTWITSIDIGKGAGSVVNGYESMSGQMNVELQKPEYRAETKMPNMLINGYVNAFGRLEGNVNYSQALSDKWSIGALGHVSSLQNELDQNGDKFRDLPLYTQYNGVMRAKYSSERWMSQFGIKALAEDRDGGQLSSVGQYRYGFTNTTQRTEVFSKTARLFPDQPYRGLGLILNATWHNQESSFGLRPYTGKQQSLYGNLIYQTIIGNTNHTVKTGVSYLLDNYHERYVAQPLDRFESVPGAFFEYAYTYPERFALVVGNRLDAHNLYGLQWTPRVHLKYHIHGQLTLRASAGRGWRVPNQIAENYGYLVSSRGVFLNQNVQPEIAWTYTAGITNEFLLFGKKATLTVDASRTDFQNQLIVDADQPRSLLFYNLQGKSYANSFQAELTISPFKRAEIKAAYRLFDARQSMGAPLGENILMPRMMVSRDRVLLNAAYALPYDKWKFDITLQWNGPKRLPDADETHTHSTYSSMVWYYSPSFVNLNAQLTRSFRTWQVYLGGENLTNYRQPNPIIGAADPFGTNFDAAGQNWGPITGAMIYAGFRFTLEP
ncbi:TonB-dependent receptor [Fibrella forsythiae]|uniref:TonB-dependent receptor n=1 Tax=Fibrella forsythiae TaxID=2817061 RepID=A0ABS3JL62_9BACT|nr:TonB-dependent receptor [Fibrella forsythiae]MBO0950733.1 TonB-dependent receptor [Fibrella forsythiae]